VDGVTAEIRDLDATARDALRAAALGHNRP
jgi:hypothetical protein